MNSSNQSNTGEPPPDFSKSEEGSQFDGYTRDLVFHILRNKRRRAVLFYLKYYDYPVTMRELSTQVAAWENEISMDELTGSQRETVHISLYQTHLPTLDEHGIIEYDKSQGVIDAGVGLDVFTQFLEPHSTDKKEISNPSPYPGVPNIEGASWRSKILLFLTPTVDSDILWSKYYLVAAVVGTILAAAASPSVSPLKLPLTAVVVVILSMFSMIAFAHVFYEASPEDVAKVERLILGRSFR